MPVATDCSALLKLMQLASPALPVGGFAYAQGLEMAIETQVVVDEHSAGRWITDALVLVLARQEAPWWLRAFDAQARGDTDALAHVNEVLAATRETAELRAEAEQMGASMCRVMPAFGLSLPVVRGLIWPTAFAAAAAALHLPREAALTAYLWSWSENQVLVAVKCVPLGQQAGQRLLFGLHTAMLRAVSHAVTLAGGATDVELGSAPVGLAMMSSRHEAQYSRLYRS